jgi:hypothetical protein
MRILILLALLSACKSTPDAAPTAPRHSHERAVVEAIEVPPKPPPPPKPKAKAKTEDPPPLPPCLPPAKNDKRQILQGLDCMIKIEEAKP